LFRDFVSILICVDEHVKYAAFIGFFKFLGTVVSWLFINLRESTYKSKRFRVCDPQLWTDNSIASSTACLWQYIMAERPDGAEPFTSLSGHEREGKVQNSPISLKTLLMEYL
jgi:hypothetical protein